jgi:hypothetical protein
MRAILVSTQYKAIELYASEGPYIAAVLILFAQNRKGVPTAAKTEWPSTQRDRRKTRAENKAITDPR